MSARARFIAIALMLPLFAACDRVETTGVDPSADGVDAVLPGNVLSSADPRNANGGGGIPLFDRLASQIEGFGGLFRNSQCQVVVVLTNLSVAESAKKIVHDALRSQLGRGSCAEGLKVDAQKGEYTYKQLSAWLAAAGALIGKHDRSTGITSGIRGVLGTAIDLQANRLVVTIASSEVAAAVLDALPRVGIPAVAVTFQIGRNTTSR
ncbi:MAG: hypothetical protein L0271_11565 [Gemmatimonadetes bacterium]|nr:hypothetical protein [Gemmatimonadota bacterium]